VRARNNFAIDVLAALVYVISTNPVATGTPAHEWAGIGVAFVVLVHLVGHWRQTAGMLQRFFGQLGRLPRLNLAVDAPLMIAFITVVMSGLLVSRSALRPLGWVVSESSVWHAVHSQSATVLLVLMGVHLGLHWSWISSAIRHRVFRPILHPAATWSWARGTVLRWRPIDLKGELRSLARVGRYTVQAVVLVVVIAAGIYGLTVTTNGAFLAAGLTMPGGSGAGLSAEPPSARAAGRSGSVAVDMRAEAESSGVSESLLAAIRSAHAFVILGLAMLAAAVVGDLVRPMRS
jgi:hypothetical protein